MPWETRISRRFHPYTVGFSSECTLCQKKKPARIAPNWLKWSLLTVERRQTAWRRYFDTVDLFRPTALAIDVMRRSLASVEFASKRINLTLSLPIKIRPFELPPIGLPAM